MSDHDAVSDEATASGPHSPFPAKGSAANDRLDDFEDFDVASPRSFLANTKPSRFKESQEELAPTVRAYLITSGRTTTNSNLGFESMVTVSSTLRPPEALQFERARLYTICLDSGAQSIAELSAHLALPIGVVKVIAGDLINEGYFDKHETQVDLSTDVLMLRRLIHGVRAL